jgi:integrase
MDADGHLYRVQRSVVLGPFLTKREAKRRGEVVLRPWNRGASQPQMDVTLADFWSRYFEPEILPTLKFSTRKQYGSLAAKHLLPWFGSRRLAEITRLQVQQFIGEKRRQGYSRRTLEHLRNLLSRVFETAISWGWLQDNLVRGVKLPPGEPRSPVRVLTPEEIARLLAALPEPSRMIVVLGVTSGLRIGELLGLEIHDVDFSRGVLTVRRAVYRGNIGTPKTAYSERAVPLAASVAVLLGDYLNSRRMASGWLFASSALTPLEDRNLMRRQMEPACDRLGIPRFGWHTLRHTFNTYGSNQGVAMPIMQSLMGHASLETTILYTHPLEGAQREAVERIAGVLCPNVPKSEPSRVGGSGLIQ